MILLLIAVDLRYAYSVAWPQNYGDQQLIITQRYFNADNLVGINGMTDPRLRHVQTRQYDLEFYYEYGYAHDLTFGASAIVKSFDTNTSSDDGQIELDRVVTFARSPVYWDDNFVFSVQSSVEGNFAPHVNDGQINANRPKSIFEIETALLAGYSFEAFDHYHFAALSLEHENRFYPNRNTNHINWSAQVGIRPYDGLMLLGNFIREDTLGLANTSALDGVYDLSKFEASAVIDIFPDTALQVGYIRNIEGANIGLGQGIFVSVWLRI